MVVSITALSFNWLPSVHAELYLPSAELAVQSCQSLKLLFKIYRIYKNSILTKLQMLLKYREYSSLLETKKNRSLLS